MRTWNQLANCARYARQTTLFLVAALTCFHSASADLYVLRMGDGTAFTNSGADAVPVFIDHLTDLGVSAGSAIALPTTLSGSNHPLTLPPSSTSIGHMALSVNGAYLTLGGYDADVGTATIRSTTQSRTIGRIKVSDGSVDTSTILSDAYPGSVVGTQVNNGDIRSVVSTDGTEFWLSGTTFPTTGGQGGIRYATYGSNVSYRVAGAPTNTRVVNIANGQLYMSSASGTFQGVSTVGTGLPQPIANDISASTILPGFPTASGPSNYDFWFKDANTVYVADDRAVASGGGIQKWEFNSGAGSWGLTYTLNSGLSVGTRGIDGAVVGGNVVLYATTGPSTGTAVDSIVSVTDAGASSAFSTLATSGANTVWRGIVFVPGAAPGVTGDYNGNGVVDAADYVLWRNDPTSFGGDPAGYNTWRSHFGNTSGGSGAGVGAAAVPEAGSVALVLLGLSLCGLKRRGR